MTQTVKSGSVTVEGVEWVFEAWARRVDDEFIAMAGFTLASSNRDRDMTLPDRGLKLFGKLQEEPFSTEQLAVDHAFVRMQAYLEDPDHPRWNSIP
jgi:hypothetical protein